MTFEIVTRKGQREVFTNYFSGCRSWASDVWPGCTLNHVHASGGYVVEYRGVAVADILPIDDD